MAPSSSVAGVVSLDMEVKALEAEVKALINLATLTEAQKDELLLTQQKLLVKKDEQLAIEAQKLAIRDGKYFAATKRVWKAIPFRLARDPSGSFTAVTYRKLVRKTVDFQCLAMSNKRIKIELYKSTKEHATGQFGSITVKSVRSTATHDTIQKVWPKDVGGNKIDEYAEGAYLLPAGTSDHVDWFRVGGAAVGLDEINSDVEQMLKATRGCKDPRKSDKKRFDFSRNKNTSLMMLVVPLLPLEEICDWKGTGYSAIVLVGEPQSETPVDNPMTDEQIHSAFSAARLNNDNLKTAMPEQVDYAAGILKAGVVALAEMILSMSDDELAKVEKFDTKSAGRLRMARNNLEDGNEVLVPDAIIETLEEDDCHVMLVSFDGHAEEQPQNHVAPDPLLLLFKAANVFGCLNGMDFLANGVIPTSDSESDAEQIELYASLLDMVQETSDTPTGMLVGVH